jgi:DNA-binding beta-propeller fold protein YncE
MTVIACLMLAACATPKKPERFTLFYPPPPELPRLQWLASFTSAKDIVPEQSAFNKFVVGEEKNVPRLDKPYGVGIFDGRIYVCDTNKTLMVFDLKKKTFERLPGAQGAGRLVQPVNISIDANGTKYVTDPLRGQVVLFDRNDNYVKAFGAPGGWKPVDAVVNGDLLFVADIKNAAVVVMDKDSGRLVRRIGRDGAPEQTLYMPTNLAFGVDGTLYVSDTGKFGIMKYDREGHFKGSIGKLGTSPGSFARPKGIAVDRAGRLYAVDAAFDNVQVFSGEGQLLFWFGHFGKTGLDPGNLFLPAKIAIDYNNVKYFEAYADPSFKLEYLVLVTSQFGDNMVNVYGFGRQRGKQYPTYEELKNELEQRLQGPQPALTAPPEPEKQ